MKHLKISLFLLGIIVSIVACQQSFEDDFGVDPETLSVNGEQIKMLNAHSRNVTDVIKCEFMPQNVIPNWVKEKLTPQEYELWMKLSQKYEIDYSILKNDLSVEEKKRLYNKIEKIYQAPNDTITNLTKHLTFFSLDRATIEGIEQLSSEESGGFQSHTTTFRVYSHPSLDISGYMNVHYSSNSATKEVEGVRTSSPYIIAKDEFDASIYADGNATYDGGYLGIISVTCAGHVTYYNPNKDVAEVDFSTIIYPF